MLNIFLNRVESGMSEKFSGDSIKISVIMPVYNTEKFLRECLDSVLNQSLKDIEIICINDGSTDNSLNILNEYRTKDERIKVFSQVNQGASSARNFGLSVAKGEYVTFVDSDDRITPDMCEKIYNKAVQTNVDIVMFAYYQQFSTNQINVDNRLSTILNNIQETVFNFSDEIKNIIPNVPYETVGKLYKASFLKDNQILFPPNIKLGEDTCFFINACINNPEIFILNTPLYYYRLNSPNSLIKQPDAVKYLYAVFVHITKLLNKKNYKNKDELYNCFTTRLTKAILHYWNLCYTISHKKRNFKYLKFLKSRYNKIKNKDKDTYNTLKTEIFEYQFLYIKKLLEPLIEIELRSTRFVVYLFGRQRINMPTIFIKSFYYNFFYFLLLQKLRFVSHFRKIRVGFFVSEPNKWISCQNLYNELKNDKHFEPFIILSYFSVPQGTDSPKDFYNTSKIFFEQKNIQVKDAFDVKTANFTALDSFKPDILFYQQPWLIPKVQRVIFNHKKMLLCYIPYCVYSMRSYVNYLPKFHAVMWKYFVETPLHKKEYIKTFGATNCEVTGSLKLDNYYNLDIEHAETYWKTKNKKRIIYAPHHSFNDGIHEVATFKENGQFILELAKQHPETEWIFRPHPALMDRIIKNDIMSEEEIKIYYKEWEKTGAIILDGNYHEMFAASDCLITDCISFLTEYAPTGKPLLHLRKDNQKEEFNDFVQKIDETYYQIYNNDELKRVFEKVVINNEDEKRQLREQNISFLQTKETASSGIYRFLKRKLWIK